MPQVHLSSSHTRKHCALVCACVTAPNAAAAAVANSPDSSVCVSVSASASKTKLAGCQCCKWRRQWRRRRPNNAAGEKSCEKIATSLSISRSLRLADSHKQPTLMIDFSLRIKSTTKGRQPGRRDCTRMDCWNRPKPPRVGSQSAR